MPRNARRQISRLVGTSCLVAARALSTGGIAVAAPDAPRNTPPGQPTPLTPESPGSAQAAEQTEAPDTSQTPEPTGDTTGTPKPTDPAKVGNEIKDQVTELNAPKEVKENLNEALNKTLEAI